MNRMAKYDPPINPRTARPHYSRFMKRGRVLLSGHSHRAWPNVTEKGHMLTLKLAREHVDRKWEIIFGEIIPEWQERVAKRIGVTNPRLLANDENTHNLVARVLTSRPIDRDLEIVTTDAEFQSLTRQALRFKE
ncbi:hypothetical protein HYT84_01365, partial [Candidatus Micrarchaeota archaeon]|nr:hypothetical protein [Candidatus Micrarchaeota archaeon]